MKSDNISKDFKKINSLKEFKNVQGNEYIAYTDNNKDFVLCYLMDSNDIRHCIYWTIGNITLDVGAFEGGVYFEEGTGTITKEEFFNKYDVYKIKNNDMINAIGICIDLTMNDGCVRDKPKTTKYNINYPLSYDQIKRR